MKINENDLIKTFEQIKETNNFDEYERLEKLENILYDNSTLTKLHNMIEDFNGIPNKTKAFNKKLADFSPTFREKLSLIRRYGNIIKLLKYHKDWLEKFEKLNQISRDLNIELYYLNIRSNKKYKTQVMDLYSNEIDRYNPIDKEQLKNLKEKLFLGSAILKAEQELLEYKITKN